MDDKKPATTTDSENSLDAPETIVQPTADAGGASPEKPADTSAPAPVTPLSAKKPFGKRLRAAISKVSIYLLLFILIIIIAGVVITLSILRSREAANNLNLSTQELTQETLEQLKNTTAKVGDPKQILSIESNAVFAGSVLVRDSLEVAGQIKVGGSLSLPGITVSGTSSFDQVQLNSLSISSDANVQGQLTVNGNLTVNGGGSFAGNLSAASLSIDNLQLNEDLQLNRHIDAGGGTPGRSNGSALGSGGTATVSGTDTAGTVTINTGGSPPAGCFITVTFSEPFNNTPHVVITPVGNTAATLDYYINRNTTSFSICTAGAPPGNTNSIIFDYIAID